MCRSNVIIYQNETKFEIYCNDKTESHHITEHILKVAVNTITWVWTKSLIMHTVTFRGIVNVEKIYCDFLSCAFFSCDFFSVYHLCIVYIISHLLEEMYEKLHIFHCFYRFCLVVFIRICVLHTLWFCLLFGSLYYTNYTRFYS